MREDWSLTWYPGSILPYSSLWFTVMRIAYLNHLGVWELNDLLYEKTLHLPIDTHQVVHVDGIGSITDKNRLAYFLGESESAFNWSQLGGSPQWVYPLIYPHHRICTECIKIGYHSSIYSIKLLEVCPIHGCKFITSCECGKAFPNSLVQRDLINPCHCRCGRFEFLSKESSRFPAVNADFTRPLEPIASWLDCIKTIVRSPTSAPSMGRNEIPNWAALIPKWCNHFGIIYPSCFTHFDAPIKNSTTKASGIKPSTTDPIETEKRFRAAYSSNSLEPHPDVHNVIYSSFSRHLRHHVAIDSHLWIKKFQESGKPLEISRWITESKAAFFGFAYMLWLREINASMNKSSQTTKYPRPHASRTSASSGSSSYSTTHVPKLGQKVIGETQQVNWIRTHQYFAYLQNIWLVALRRAVDAIEPGEASWGYLKNSIFVPELIAHRDSNGLLDLLEIQIEKNDCLIEPPRPGRKGQRIAAEQQRLARLLNCFQDETLENYLTRDDEVWREVSPMAPDGKLFRQWNLINSGIFRHPFWLFSSGEFFVARSRILPLQFCKVTTSSAVVKLRKGSISYIGKNKIRLPDYEQKFIPSKKSTRFGMSRRRLMDSYLGKSDISNFWKLGDLEQFHKERKQIR